MKTTYKLSFLFLMILAAVSCNNGKSFIPNSTGVPYEVLVVMDKNAWKGEAGDAIREELSSDIPFLPQSEPSYKISSVDPAHFDNLLHPVRNIVIVTLSNIYTRIGFSYEENVWANNQMVLHVNAPDAATLKEGLTKRQRGIVNFFNKCELNRAFATLQEKHNTQILTDLKKQMDVELLVPGDVKYTKVGKDFLWISNQGVKGRSDVVVYSFPYKSKNDFSRDHLLMMRDSILKQYITGAPKGSYMATEYRAPVICDTIEVNGKFCVQIGGLWQMEHDMMGGPFISQSRLDEKNQRIVTVEGFVFAPEMGKRNLIRRLEAVLYTLKLPGDLATESLPLDVEKSK
ncbi:MAG: DUF4837 family protein [Bacteroidales bacterium]|nr:DUF4837 family protein [Bacteroidales bacterium]